MARMRPIVAFNRVSADGYFTSNDGSLDWTVPEPELDKEAGDQLGGMLTGPGEASPDQLGVQAESSRHLRPPRTQADSRPGSAPGSRAARSCS